MRCGYSVQVGHAMAVGRYMISTMKRCSHQERSIRWLVIYNVERVRVDGGTGTRHRADLFYVGQAVPQQHFELVR